MQKARVSMVRERVVSTDDVVRSLIKAYGFGLLCIVYAISLTSMRKGTKIRNHTS